MLGPQGPQTSSGAPSSPTHTGRLLPGRQVPVGAEAGEYQPLTALCPPGSANLGVRTKVVSGMQRTEKGIPAHFHFQFWFLLMPLGPRTVSDAYRRGRVDPPWTEGRWVSLEDGSLPVPM